MLDMLDNFLLIIFQFSDDSEWLNEAFGSQAIKTDTLYSNPNNLRSLRNVQVKRLLNMKSCKKSIEGTAPYEEDPQEKLKFERELNALVCRFKTCSTT